MALSTRVIGKFGGAPEVREGTLTGQSATLTLTEGQWLLAVKMAPYPSSISIQSLLINRITVATVKVYNSSDSYFYGVATVDGGSPVAVSVASSSKDTGTLISYIATKTG